MTEKTLYQIRELEDVAELAGGYVSDPSKLVRNPAGEVKFTEIRQYCLKRKIPMSAMTDEDYKVLGFSKKNID